MHRHLYIAILLALGCGTPFASPAQSLEDFLNAAKNEGCAAIPYPEMFRACRDKQQDVKDYCDTTSCSALDSHALQQRIDRNKETLVAIDRQRGETSSKRDAASDDEKRGLEDELARLDREIDNKKRENEDLAHQIDDFKYRARGLIDKGQRCRESRIDVVEIFDDATKKARDENDPAIKAAVAGSLAEFERSEKGHTIKIKETQEGINKCEKAARGESLD